MNFNYVLQISWPTVECRHSATSSNPITPDTNSTTCWQTLLSVFGISLAHHLKTTSYLNLPDLATYTACPTDFQSKLNILKLPINLATFCFDTCWQTLLSVFGISLAHHLKTTSYLNLPDLATYTACPTDFQSKLNILKLPINLATFCFDPVQFKQLFQRSSAKIFHFAHNRSDSCLV
ncbi:putative SPARK domain-containing protein [Helianthus debilis subsp. tardiflorus]